MTLKTIERIFNKHQVTSIAITVCMTCIIIAYLTFGSGIINWDRVNETNTQQVITQNVEQKTSELQKDTISKSIANSDEDTKTEYRQEEVEYTSIYRIIHNIMCIIAIVLACITLVLGVFALVTS